MCPVFRVPHFLRLVQRGTETIETKQKPPRVGWFLRGAVLHALYVDCVHSFWRILCLECYSVALTEVVELYTDKSVTVKEQILRHTFACNETETIFLKGFNCTFHKKYLIKLTNIQK